MAAIGTAFLSASIQTLIQTLADKLVSKEFLDYIKSTKLDVSLLKQLRLTLLTLQPVLDAAEEKQINTPSVKDWLDGLKDAIYDAEDLLNQISYDSLRCKMENKQPASKTNQVWNILSSPFKNIYGEINSQMKDMCETLKLFADNKDILSLQTKSVRVSHRTPSNPMFDESVMVGRKDDQKKVINMLLSESNTNMGVVAFVGMGGIGKTTLAQRAYNDEKVQKHFDITAWACVSEDFDILRVTKTLLESVTKTPSQTDNLDLLRVDLKKNLKDRRFLIVLDDLWNDTHHDWEDLVSPLIYGKNGSRVIITTRHKKVADAARTFPIFELDPLSDEDSWSLLSKHAFGSGDFSEAQQRNVEAIGRNIARKCGGLPIASKSLGGLLRSKVDTEEWIEVLNNDIWNLKDNNILPALHLSYQYLPSQLKRCFSYCSIFPKDYPLDRKQLVLLWMAEGFLDNSQVDKTMEEVGDGCFTELLSRSLIQQLHDDSRGQKFVLHDLVNDLATVVSKKSCYRLEFGAKSYENVRHLSYNKERYDIFKKFKTFDKFQRLRSFLAIHLGWRQSSLSRKVVEDLLPTFGRLRVLLLSRYKNITTLPVTIGNLVQLRYLDLSFTNIASLPDTICNLYYLQTLILSCCSELTELPEHVGKLINLRHLYIDYTSIIEMPKQIAELENLQTLTVFVVGKKNIGLSVRELGKFPKLRGKLLIKNLQNVNDVVEVSDANLKSKEHIKELTLQWGKETDDTLNEKNVLDMLEPSTNLKKLRIMSYGGTSFPSWFGDPSFSNMVYLSIGNCANCMTLPPLGQLHSLKDLQIGSLTILETIGQQFYGMAAGGSHSSFQPFQSLENLEFSCMGNWKEWCPFPDNMFPFPRLKTLRLSRCPKLKGYLPSNLPSLEEIEIYDCDHLLATPPTQHWLSSVKKIRIVVDSDSISNTERTQYSLLESDSPCLLRDIIISSRHMLKSVPKMIINSPSLRNLTLKGISSLTAIPTNGLPTSLQSLRIEKCENLTFLPPEMWSNYTSLVTLTLGYCKALTSVPLNCFPMLQKFSIYDCNNLESIFISETLPCSSSALQSFYVRDCKALRSLPQGMNTLTALEDLYLRSLPNLNLSLCEGVFLPPNLQSIEVDSVRITKPVTEWGLQGLTALSSMTIEGDDIVNMLLKEQLLPISLVSIRIDGLSEMKFLEGNGLRHLSSLEGIGFSEYSGLVSFPEKAFPSSLKKLYFGNCPRLESFPEKAFPSSLKTLEFRNCPRIESFPEKVFPSSLKTLEFSDCPRLESLPEDSLPTFLEDLTIRSCPLLEERYKQNEHLSKIAHIPVIKINDQLII
ncbi:putative disease resistance RPP13-like protein 1 [Vicia villosa]|uniref:putative disease resistance RPP13-like protein 1 n=1 Tax=Vicia villosa TaxID=3911 RepID=UPI00273AFAE8|nr:putative disease resistance RPP13-like protein 1 [Vicia villosa]XP_058721476.1 putative disease resistance RPP13-like protein 1 [Vicia villosa]